MNRSLLTVTLALGLAAGPFFALAQPAAAPAAVTQVAPTQVAPVAADSRLSAATVSVQVGRYGGPLSSLLAALARAAGYTPILDADVDAALGGASGEAARPVVYDITGKPFNEVWPLLMDVYGLSYQLLRIGDQPALRISVGSQERAVYAARGDAAPLAELLRAQFPDLRVTPAPGGQLILSGERRDVQAARAVLAQVDTAPAPAAATSARELRQVYAANSAPAPLGAVITAQFPGLRVNVLEAGRQLVISGPEAQVQAALSLLAEVDRAPAPALAEAPPARTVYTVRGNLEQVQAALTAQLPGLTVTPLAASRQLVLSGPAVRLTEAEALLAQIDAVPTAAPAERAERIYEVRGNPADIAAVLAARFPGIEVVRVGAAGPLILGGAEADLTAALALLGQIDRPLIGPSATVQQIFRLANADAEALRDELSRGLEGGALGGAVITGPAAQTAQTAAAAAAGAAAGASAATPAPAPAPALVIMADPRTNSLIVRGTQAQVDQIASIIPALDLRVPQINVQVRIQEISESASRTLGLDWSAGLGNFVVRTVGGAITGLFDATRSLAGINLGATLDALQTQNLSRRVYDGSVTMQSGQRAGAQGGSVQRTGADAAATIRSGGRLEINIPGDPPIVRQIDYGVMIDFVNPQVNADGTISMRVRAEVSNLNTAITSTSLPNLLDFSNTSAATNISFRSGETVLLGGLLSDVNTRSNSGVPFLSSLPIIGGLFGRTTTGSERTQLLVVITGNVVE